MSVSHAASLRYQFLFFSVDFAGEGVMDDEVFNFFVLKVRRNLIARRDSLR
jgi:hypothetical protein